MWSEKGWFFFRFSSFGSHPEPVDKIKNKFYFAVWVSCVNFVVLKDHFSL